MIIREIVNNQTLLETFDFYNDYKDTKNWLEARISNTKYVLDELEKAYHENHIKNPKQGEENDNRK